MSDAPSRIMAWPDYPDGWMTGSWSANQYHTDLAVPYMRADLSDALIREAVAALEGVIHVADRDTDIFNAARATLAKLRAHLEGEKE